MIRRGIGSELLEAVRGGAMRLGRDSVWGRVRDSAALAFVVKRGFAEVTQEVNVVRHRRGLATALKRAQIHWAADHGYRELVSDMVEGNAAVRAVNERLGYRPLPPVFIVSGSVS